MIKKQEYSFIVINRYDARHIHQIVKHHYFGIEDFISVHTWYLKNLRNDKYILYMVKNLDPTTKLVFKSLKYNHIKYDLFKGLQFNSHYSHAKKIYFKEQLNANAK